MLPMHLMGLSMIPSAQRTYPAILTETSPRMPVLLCAIRLSGAMRHTGARGQTAKLPRQQPETPSEDVARAAHRGRSGPSAQYVWAFRPMAVRECGRDEKWPAGRRLSQSGHPTRTSHYVAALPDAPAPVRGHTCLLSAERRPSFCHPISDLTLR